MRIAVIGACGLVAAKKLLDQGLAPTVFERGDELGGNWRYGAPGSSRAGTPRRRMRSPNSGLRRRLRRTGGREEAA